ncbi:hypothetical protein [Tenacibaculum agarivorans]|uniref:hypothetical protein n=1 Tax=Tenacibaculum agarivorans TaxID=1908389 RepID=UPI00094BAE62|nr:hypothetical protein [Tenacibaculum agarivorans]
MIEIREKIESKETKFGDFRILSAARKSPVWKELFNDRDRVWDRIYQQWFRYLRGMVGWSYCAVFRTKTPGVNHTGIIISATSCFFLASINSTDIWWIFKGLGVFYIPISMLWKDSSEIFQMLITNSQSKILLIYNAILVITSLYRVIAMYFLGRRYMNNDLNARGTSWLYVGIKALLAKWRVRVNERLVEGIEPFLVAGLGVLFFSFDRLAGTYFVLMAVNEIAVRALNYAATLDKRTLIEA